MEIKITDKSTGQVYTSVGELVTLFEKINSESDVSPVDVKLIIPCENGETLIEDYCGEAIILPENYHVESINQINE